LELNEVALVYLALARSRVEP